MSPVVVEHRTTTESLRRRTCRTLILSLALLLAAGPSSAADPRFRGDWFRDPDILARFISSQEPDRDRISIDRIAFASGHLFGSVRFDARRVATLAACVADSEPFVRAVALAALNRRGPTTKPALAAVVGALDDEHVVVRLHAAVTLASLAPDHEETMPALLRLLQDPDRRIATEARDVLEDFRGTSRPALDALLEAVDDEDSENRELMVRLLGRFGEARTRGVPQLLRRLEDEEAAVRAATCLTLGRVRPEGEAVIAALAARSRDESPLVRSAAARTLGCYRHAARAAVPALIALLEDTDDSVVLSAVYALARIDPGREDAVARLRRHQEHADPEIRRWAAYALDGGFSARPGYMVRQEGREAYVSNRHACRVTVDTTTADRKLTAIIRVVTAPGGRDPEIALIRSVSVIDQRGAELRPMDDKGSPVLTHVGGRSWPETMVRFEFKLPDETVPRWLGVRLREGAARFPVWDTTDGDRHPLGGIRGPVNWELHLDAHCCGPDDVR